MLWYPMHDVYKRSTIITPVFANEFFQAKIQLAILLTWSIFFSINSIVKENGRLPSHLFK